MDSVGESGNSSSCGDLIDGNNAFKESCIEDDKESPPKWFNVIKDY